MHVASWGSGPPVVLVHGGGGGGEANFSHQRPLAERWRLLLPDRPGHGRSAAVGDRPDFAVDAPLVAELLADGAHLVGHSYGAVVALLAAASRPDAVRSLTVIEPPAFSVAPDDAGVRAFGRETEELFTGATDPDAFVANFFRLAGLPGEPPVLPPAAVAAMRRIRGPWEADLPLRPLADTGIPTLVVSGGHRREYEVIADRITAATGGRREVVRGAMHAAHTVVPRFNEVLESHLVAAEAHWRSRTRRD